MPLRLHADESPSAGPDRVWAGDESAFEALFREHYHGLAAFAARIVGSDAVAEELVQDVLLRMWEQRERLVITESVAAYLYSAVRNQALYHLRHERVDRRWQEDRSADRRAAGGTRLPPTDDRARAAELAAAIERAIGLLPPRCREAYLLRRQHHLSYAEIARVMAIAPKTVEIHIGAALRSLRVSLAEWLVP
jgi:RNA polymerase sigma-70 factor (family 1)